MAGKRGNGAPSRHPIYQNYLTSGAPPLAPPRSDHLNDDPTVANIVYEDAAYGSRDSVAACARAVVVPDILHRINVTARGKGSEDAWGYR